MNDLIHATLIRHDFDQDGIFGEFYFDGDKDPFMVTLEHAYQQEDGSFAPKVPPGEYKCVFGKHFLHSGPVDTFEIMGVEGHSRILCCHIGNFNRDSDGCVLGGKDVIMASIGVKMLTDSAKTFQKFRARLDGVEEFMLTVE